jgi:apoptosis-inducing factor 2
MAHQIVVIGASFAGLTVSQNLLKTILPPLTKGDKKFKVTLVNPSEEFYWKIGAPRMLVNPASLPVEKGLVAIPPVFSKYSAEQFEFIVAYASSIDANTKTVKLSTDRSLSYDSLIICSGTGFNVDLWSTSKGSEVLKAALNDLHEKIPGAETILIAGGGPAGVETAGEFGELYGNKKDITLLSGTTNLLNTLQNKNVGKDAEGRLTKQGIKVVHGVQVTSHRVEGGKEVVQLSNGESKTVDIYIEAIGDKPNSSFVPKEWLTERGQVKTDPQTLRLDVPGVQGVYAFGTVASYSNGSIADVMFAKKAILATLTNDLSGAGKSVLRMRNSVANNLQSLALEPRMYTRRSPAICSSFPLALPRGSVLLSAGSSPASWSKWPNRRIS